MHKPIYNDPALHELRWYHRQQSMKAETHLLMNDPVLFHGKHGNWVTRSVYAVLRWIS